MELAGATYPAEVNGLKTSPIEGKSIFPMLNGEIEATHDTIFWEHERGKALRIGDWKISALGRSEWELFNIAEDRTETNNLATEMPEKVKEMEAAWRKRAKEMGIQIN
jgi:arylsulfatase